MSRLTFTLENLDMLLDDLGDYSLRRVRLISDLLEMSGGFELLSKWRAEDEKLRHPGGRPATMGDRGAFVLVFMLALDGRALHMTTMAKIVARRFDCETLEFLGMNTKNAAADKWYYRIQNAIQAILDVIDPCPLPDRRRRLTREEWELHIASLDQAVMAIRQERLDILINGLIDATWQALPAAIRDKWLGNTSVDATVYKAYGQNAPGALSSRMPIEPDAAWWVREGDHNAAAAAETAKRLHFGWDLHMAVTIANGDEVPEFPIMVMAMAADKPGTDIAGNTLSMYTSLRDRGHKPGRIVGDLAYFAGQKAETFSLPLAALGHQAVTDYRVEQLGVHDGHEGAVMVEGKYYCPCMPQELIDATIQYLEAGDFETWQKRLIERQRYEAKPHGKPDADGYQRFSHPTNSQGKSVCDSGRENAPAFCRQKTITIPPDNCIKIRQELRFGTQEWLSAYGHGRNCIETFNAYVKDEGKQALGAADRRRVRGYAAQTLFGALLVAAANVRKAKAFFDDVAKRQRRGEDTSRPRRRKSTLTYNRKKILDRKKKHKTAKAAKRAATKRSAAPPGAPPQRE